MDHRAPPQPPPPSQELQLPLAAVVPMRRRRSQRKPRQATIPIVPPPAALQAPSIPQQIRAPTADAMAADAHNLLLLAHTALSLADAEAEAEAQPQGNAADCEEAACPEPQGNAGSSGGDQRGKGVASPAAAASPMHLGDDEEDELEPGEIPPEKPAAGSNADSAHGSSLGKEEEEEEEMAAGEEEAKTAIAGEPAETSSSSAHRADQAVVGRDGEPPAAEVSAAEQKRMREVFVGGLSKDAREEDIRAALSAAGEITQVRMLKDRMDYRNNIGYCFVAFREAAMASKAVAEYGNVKICGKPCRVAVPEGNERTKKVVQRDPIIENFYSIYEQRQPSTLAVHSSYTSWGHHASYAMSPIVASPAGYHYPMYHNGNIMYLPPPDLNRGLAGPTGRSQMGQSSSCRPGGKPNRSRN